MWTPWTTRKASRQQLWEQLHDSDDEMHRVSAVHLEMIFEYYDDVLREAKTSFSCAVVFAFLGFSLLAGTVYVVVNDPYDPLGTGTIGVVSGGLVEFISAVAFFIYKRATDQFNSFHICLERTNRYLMAYNIIEIIDGENNNRDATRHELACILAQAPMLALKHIDTPPIVASRRSKEESTTDTPRKSPLSSDDMLQLQPNHA